MPIVSATVDRVVYRRADGEWVNKRVDANRPSSLHRTQVEAIQAAKKTLLRQGGGELIVMGENGRIRSKDTYPRSRDPFPPRDLEH
jgi:hypothetical protein